MSDDGEPDGPARTDSPATPPRFTLGEALSGRASGEPGERVRARFLQPVHHRSLATDARRQSDPRPGQHVGVAGGQEDRCGRWRFRWRDGSGLRAGTNERRGAPLRSRASGSLAAGSLSSGWLHPGLYDWPLPGSLEPQTQLPVMNWTTGPAHDVVARVREQWDDLSSRKANLRCFFDTGVAGLERLSNGRLSLSVATPTAPLECDVVIIAVGFPRWALTSSGRRSSCPASR
jgi:hypothetical protein